MSETMSVNLQEHLLSIRRMRVALVGNPNTGKTTLFNALTGLSQRVGNFPGVTVERKVGRMILGENITAELIDLPGAYSLSPQSPDEAIAVDVLLGLWEQEEPINAILAVLDASNLKRNLYLVSQLLDMELPLVVALNMSDVARSRGIIIDEQALGDRLGVPVISIQANKREGLNRLKTALLHEMKKNKGSDALMALPESWREPVREMVNRYRDISPALVVRIVTDPGGGIFARTQKLLGAEFGQDIGLLRARFQSDMPVGDIEIAHRYGWIEQIIDGVLQDPDPLRETESDRIDKVLTHRVWGTLIFAAIMGFIFESIFTWSAPIMDLIDAAFASLGNWALAQMPKGALQSLIVDGLIAGVGGVVIFLPQICILFLFIAILEDCGYMARAALLMDRLLTQCGLSGKSFIPMLSSFACAVPGVMATRTIDDRKDRIATMLVAPLMSCSARLPVYAIFIAAFIPDTTTFLGFGLQGVTLFCMYGLGIVVAVPVAWLLKKTLLKGETTPFILELPSYKFPDVRTVLMCIYQNAYHFLKRAGTLILAATVVMWGLAYFPRSEEAIVQYEQQREMLVQAGAEEGVLEAFDARVSGDLISNSYLGYMGKTIEPLVKPLGWDWRIGMATLASFPAREVIVAALGTIYSLGRVDESSQSLQEALQQAVGPDGRRVFSIPVALSIMVFFALCAQCVSTLAVIQRETGTWAWPLLTFGYMTALAYFGAFATYRIGMALGWG